MGQMQTTPLSLMLSHFSDVRERARILSIDIRRERFQIYCISEWPTFDVGWHREGSFHLPIILQVKAVIFRNKPDGHRDQMPNILAWQDMIENSPPWLKPFLLPKAHNSAEGARSQSRSPGPATAECWCHLVHDGSSFVREGVRYPGAA
ncbi:uncharacterized protein LOC119872662 isoform X1 [Canis lupus familiaris]|uniref:uncharacterized protein LOC119872662 isoform X1 n=1 Tax=Canis lupus familiaris TaxID=9615 RepID=UPI0018F291AF|nr:uncharacterized protein LOC119872662 isoform X1 [Canis lupus familiaris]XP_038436184.1 uncharacterized protein LOC119872662 isoform X1 [Canis lupus familiaris]